MNPAVESPPAPASPLSWRGWLVAAVGALWLLFVLQAGVMAAEGERRLAPGAASGLGVGPASLVIRDPVAALAVDLAEHLPGGTDGLAAALPLHAHDAGHQPAEEVQGAELSVLPRFTDAALMLTERRRPPLGEDCRSADPRLADRPPPSTDAKP